MSEQYIDIVFDGPPSAQSGRFIEVENEKGQSIKTGEWIEPDEKDDCWRLRLKVKPGMNALATMINETSTAHGFWPEGGRNFGEMLMLATSELAEALEEHRSGRPAHYYTITTKAGQVIPEEAQAILTKIRDNMDAENLGSEPIHEITPEDERRLAELGVAKPEGVAVELADCIIRCLDTMHSLGVDIDQIVQEKMAYNDSRPHKHGKTH